MSDQYDDGFHDGQQSKQSEIDELRKRIDEAQNLLCKLQYSSGDRIYKEVSIALKGKQMKIDAMQECMDDAIKLIDEGNSWDAKELLK